MRDAVDGVKHLLTKLRRNPRARTARTGVADNGVARIAERNRVPLEGGSRVMDFGIVEVLLLKGGQLAVVDACRYGGDGVARQGVSYWVVLARDVLECAIILGYNREMTLLPWGCLLYTSPSPRDGLLSRMPSSA